MKKKFKKKKYIVLIKLKNMSLSKLTSFLNKRKVISGEYNLQSIAGPKFNKNGKYYIKSEKDFESFLKIYKDVLKSGTSLHFLEPPFKPERLFNFESSFNNYNVAKIDLDFAYDYDAKLEKSNKQELIKHKYDHTQIKKIVSCYISHLSKYVDLDDKISFPNEFDSINEGLRIILLERKEGYISVRKDTKKCKDGIHIIIPTFAFPIPVLHQVRQDLLKDSKFIKIISDIKQNNKIEDVLDESVISKNAWFLYGSGKAMSDPYTITKIYKLKLNKDTGELKVVSLKSDEISSYTSNQLETVHKLSNFGIKQTVPMLDASKLDELEELYGEEGNYSQQLQNKNEFEKAIGINSHLNLKSDSVKKPESPSITLHNLEAILDCLKDERASNYADWWKIGQALYNIDWHRGIVAFVNFSKRCMDKFDQNEIKKIWRTYEKNYLNNRYQFNIKYLKDLALADNKKKYKKIADVLMVDILTKIIDIFREDIYKKKIGDSTLSKEIKKIIDTDSSMNFVSIENKHWYYYENHKWILDSEGNKIKMYLKDKVLSIFKKYYHNCCDTHKHIQNKKDKIKFREDQCQERSNDTMDDLLNSNISEINSDIQTVEQESQNINQLILQQTIIEERLKVANRLVTYLEDSAKRTTLVKELATEFYDANFYKNLDCNPNVFHCINGVFDLELGEFRDGVPSDMVTISSNNVYIDDELRYSDPEYIQHDREFNDFLDKILPDEELKEYMLNIWAIALSGKSIKQTCNVCTGTGSNGKTVNFELLELVFGEYFSTASPALLTKGRNDANAPSPAVANLRGKRLVCCSEPDEKEPIKTGVMKEMTGGDRLVGRHLNMPPIEFKPQHLIFFLCNDKPDIESTDEGTWRRIRVTPYLSKFCDIDNSKLKNPKKYKFHYEKDNTIKEKFDLWKEVVLNELIRRYIELKGKNFNIELPKLVKEAIDDYKSIHNVYETFKKDCLHKSAGERLQSGDAFDAFKQHAEQCNQKIRNINRNTFITEMTRVLGKLKGGNKYWKDWAIVENYEDDEDDDEENVSDSEDDN